MDKRALASKLIYVLLGFSLLLTVSCKKNITVFKSYPNSDSNFADTDQRKLEWEYKRKERQLKRQERKTAKFAKSKVNKDIAKVIRAARSYRGTPYKFGGTTRIGMDCSGLLCTSFQTIDVKLPRNSTAQSYFGKEIRTKDLRPGDLVFFSSSGSARQITHVGMITDVKSRDEVVFIHASTSLGVIEDNLYSKYYQKIFVKAVRPNI